MYACATQELEEEMAGLGEGQPDAQKLTRLLRKKDLQASYVNHMRTRLHQLQGADTVNAASAQAAEVSPEAAAAAAATWEGPSRAVSPATAGVAAGSLSSVSCAEERWRLREAIDALEAEVGESEAAIEQMVAAEGNHVNQYWGYMSRAGFADKSHLMRQIEKYADIYTSRVSNLLPYTPYKLFLCQRQSLAHSTSGYSGRPLMEHWQIADLAAGDVADGETPPRWRASGE